MGIVAVVGAGLLADFVCGELTETECAEVVRQADLAADVPQGTELVLILHDDGDSFDYFQAEEALQQAGIPWLRGFVSGDEGVVGPLVRPGVPGCSQCADNRRFTAAAPISTPTSGHGSRSPSAMRLGLWHVAHLLAAEALRVLQGERACSEEHLYLVNLTTLKSSLHFILPDPLCPVCGRMPDDCAAAAEIPLKPNPKLSADGYRCRSLDDLQEVLGRDYVDARTGLLNAKLHDLASPFAAVDVNLPSFMAGDEAAGGRSHSYAQSELTAIMEGLERYCGQTPRGKRTVIHDSYDRVALQALDPGKAGLYSEEQYAQPDFPYEPFDPHSPIDWVWGYSLLQQRPLLVPETLAYYSSGYGGEFVQEGSNGCALGGSLEEAIMYGILEVVERDSFLIAWYAELPAPRLDPYSANDKELQLMVDRLRAVAGYEVHLFNITMENRIPSIWAMAKSGNPGSMNLLCTAGAHPDPVRAAKSAIHELAGRLLALQDKFAAGREQCEAMLRDPFLVREMEDHSMLYGLPQAEERLLFLLDGRRPLRTFEEEFALKTSHADLTDDLKEIMEVFRRLQLDVIAVDQSSPETLRSGLYCVKVLIPGMLPMTFGHYRARLTGLERVLKVPAQLGYAEEPLAWQQLNPHPHPFL